MTKIRRSEGRPLRYPKGDTITKTFHVKYNKKLSPVAKLVLNNLHNKYFFYAIEDILSVLKSRPIERDAILAILYSPVLSLQNNFSINFFDIWIQDIYISETSKFNKFLNKKNSSLESFNYVTIKFFYTIKPPTTKTKTLW
jgi:hypothetical protein